MNRDFELIKAYIKWQNSLDGLKADRLCVKDGIQAFLNSDEYRKVQSTVPARLDADGSAKPLTRIVHHPKEGGRIGPGMVLINPEYETEEGERIPLK